MNTQSPRFHAILSFLCPITSNLERAKVWFCSDNCRAHFIKNVTHLNETKRGSLVEKFCATHHNSNNQCGECGIVEEHCPESKAKFMPSR